MKKIYILDASGFLYRAYFAIRGLSSTSGESTNALYGFIRSVHKLLDTFCPDYVVAVFDGPSGKKSRLDMYQEYKAHRKPSPPDLLSQIEDAKRFCSLTHIPQITSSGVEADDVIASISRWASVQGFQVFVCSGDKDLLQLVNEKVSIINPHKENLVVDVNKVHELYGIFPHQMVDYLAIIGDTSDNVPGIAGLGPKAAVSLLNEYESLENILDHAGQIGGKRQKILEENKELALLSKRLIQLQETEVPQEEGFFHRGHEEVEELGKFYQEKNFHSLINTLPKKDNIVKASYHIITTEQELCDLVNKLNTHAVICFDTETTDIYPLNASLVGVGLGVSDQEAYYIPCNGSIPKDAVIAQLQPLFESQDHAFFGHNCKYDMHILENEGISIKHLHFDTILASYVLHAERRRHSLDELSRDLLGIVKIATSDLLGKGKQEKNMSEVDIDRVGEYCCEDVFCTFQLKQILEKELDERNMKHLLVDIELPLVFVLEKMERHGVYVDVSILQKLSQDVQRDITRLEKEVFRLAGEEFNINSPKQLSVILYEKMGITPPKKGKTMPSTGADVLHELAYTYPIASTILEYRSLEKLRSTYIDALPNMVLPRTQRIHCQFNQSSTATGRLSCHDPNLQNIPIRTVLGKQIRAAFCAQNIGWSLLAADYSQIELRIVAHLTQDPNLLHAFQTDQDIHSYTASLVFNVPQDAVTDDMRRTAKAVNFGIIYGQQAFGLAQELRISVKEADRFIRCYFERYPKVKEYMEHAKELARKTAKTVTFTGRERSIPEINSTNGMLRSAAERLAINTPIQGAAADLMKMSMIRIDAWLTSQNLKTKMLLQIHDELLFEVPDEELEVVSQSVRYYMEHVMSLSVPLRVSMGIGKNWMEC